MNQKNLQQQAAEIGDILTKNYDFYRYDERFTLWGISFYWNIDNFLSVPHSSFAEFFPALLEHAVSSGLRVKEPECSISKRRSVYHHYRNICLSNRDLVEQCMEQLLPPELHHLSTDIINDSRLLREAATTYVEKRERKSFSDNVDFISFLLRYNPAETTVDLDGKDFHGIYLPLAERLLYRYGEKAESELFKDQNEVVQKAAVFHHQAIYSGQNVDPTLQQWFDDIGLSNDDSSKNQPLDKILSIHLPGPYRVRKSHGSNDINWEEVERQRRKEINVSSSINPTEIYLKSIEERLLIKAEREFAADPSQALERLRSEISRNEGIQKEVLERIFKVCDGAYRLTHHPNLNHTMRIIKPRNK